MSAALAREDAMVVKARPFAYGDLLRVTYWTWR